MGKFSFRSCKGFAAAVSAGVLLVAVAAFAVIWYQADDADTQTAVDIPENPLQIILSLGAEPGQLSISWKGDAAGPDTLQLVKGEAEALQKDEAETFAAKKERILKSDYYRWHISLTGLAQGREYRYKIGEFTGSFRVPKERETTKFLYLGDVQFQDSMAEYEEWGSMVKAAYRVNPDLDFAVIGGDLVNSPGELAQWEAFLDACDVFARLPVMTVAGNH